jgi:hypothetical protein
MKLSVCLPKHSFLGESQHYISMLFAPKLSRLKRAFENGHSLIRQRVVEADHIRDRRIRAITSYNHISSESGYLS